jgi:hypothetical protein
MDISKKRNMSKQYKLKQVGYPGYYFLKGKGFTASKAGASVLSEQDIACAANLGYTGVSEALPVSFGVVYIRKGEGQRLLAGLGKNPANPNAGQVDPSKRRFATRDEADTHGSRFRTRKANAGDAEGSAGHEGYFVVETNDPVNSAVNWKTGLTNSIKV